MQITVIKTIDIKTVSLLIMLNLLCKNVGIELPKKGLIKIL